MIEHVLPHLSLQDLSSLEQVDRASLTIVRSKEYWKWSLRHVIRNTPKANVILHKHGINSVSLLTEDRNENRDHLFYKRLSFQLKADLQRLMENLKEGSHTKFECW